MENFSHLRCVNGEVLSVILNYHCILHVIETLWFALNVALLFFYFFNKSSSDAAVLKLYCSDAATACADVQ